MAMDAASGTRQAVRGRSLRIGLRVAGPALLAATGGIHLDLYLTGYRSVPTIGWLFLLQVIAAFGLALAVLVTGSRASCRRGRRLRPVHPRRIPAVHLGRAVRVQGGPHHGGDRRRGDRGRGLRRAGGPRPHPAVVPAAGAAARTSRVAGSPAGRDPGSRLGGGLCCAIALVLLGVAVSGAGGPTPASTSASGSLKAVRIGGVSVLANARGFTLYWFAPDTPAKSVCNGSCAAYGPPVKGPVTAGPGVAGSLGTIKRSDGSTQATYDGHPLYTYVGDSAPRRGARQQPQPQRRAVA